AARGYTSGLASNYDKRLRSVVEGLPELKSVEHLVISSEVGWRKPSAQFFAAICDAVQLPPGKILHVGDDPANDYQGAVSCGLRAVLLDPEAKYPLTGATRIARLAELVENLGMGNK